jgi:hypothetical protein
MKNKIFEIEYYYLATGMEGVADTYPKKRIKAESKDLAIYEYHSSNGINFNTFEEFMSKEQYIREWGITCKEIIV